MAEPVFNGGFWWHQQPDGRWLWWNAARGSWDPFRAPQPIQFAQPLKELGSWLERVLTLFIFLDVIALAVAIADAARGENTGAGVTIVGYVQAAVNLALIGLGLLWFFRAYSNLRPLGVPRLRFSPGWSVGAWFIPIFNLWRPKQIANDIWRGSDPDAPADQGDAWQQAAVPSIVHVWWAVWVASSCFAVVLVVDALSKIDFRNNSSNQQVHVDPVLTAVGAAIGIASAVCWILVVRGITARQEARIARLSS
jgi:hypothetical protein